MEEKKKKYEAPEMKVYQVKPSSIICTSGNQVQTNDLNYDSGEYPF